MKNLIRSIHLWLSIPFGIIITLVCFSGAMLVFEPEITEMCHPERFYVKEVKADRLPVGELVEKVAATLPDSVAVTGVSIFSNPQRAYQVNLSKPHRAYVSIDQYTGEIMGLKVREGFFSHMLNLHLWISKSLKPGNGIVSGKLIVGVSTIVFVFVLITGVIIWWPKTLKSLKNRLKISIRNGGWRFWYDLHLAGGMYALIFLLAMALTGLTWAFPWYRSAFYKVFGVEMQNRPAKEKIASSNTKGKETQGKSRDGNANQERNSYVSWQHVYEQLSESNPDFKQITVSSKSATVLFDRLGNQRATDRYAFNPKDGEITEVTKYEDQDKSLKIRGWIYSVHVGSLGGMFTRILAFIAALIGASLPLTGYYLWIKRIYGKNK